MRKLALALVLLAGARADAEPFLELGGGLVVPVSDDTYTDAVDPSLKLAARIGGGGPSLGGMASIDWTPVSEDNDAIQYNRVRVLGHVQVKSQVSSSLEIVGRFGAGIDYVHGAFDFTILGVRVEGSDDDIGLALEAGAGAWFTVGASGRTQVGLELALPISIHSSEDDPNDNEDVEVDYTGIDFDLLAGVRLRL